MEEALAVDGINVCYDVEGKGDNLLLIHGLGAGRKVWDHLIPQASRLFTVYAMDLPGFGCSDKPDVTYGVPFYVEFIIKFMDATGIDKTAIAGSSMGGTIAAAFAAKYPDKVTRLLLIAPSGLTPLHSPPLKSIALADASFWLMSHSRGMLEKMFEDLFYDRSNIPQELVDAMWLQMKDPNYRRAYTRNSTYLSYVHQEFPESLKQITAPVLILWGANDAMVPVADADKFAAMIPGSEVKLFDRCGHMVLQEAKGASTDAILSFLGEVDMYYTNDEI